MAGEFCTKRNEEGRLCIMASGHHGACVFSAVKPPATAAEPTIYDRRPDEPCSCARLNAREGTSLTYFCSRCAECVPSTTEWVAPTNEAQERFNRSFWDGLAARQATPAAMLGEALEHVKRAYAVLTKHGHIGLTFNASVLAEQIDAAKREGEARGAAPTAHVHRPGFSTATFDETCAACRGQWTTSGSQPENYAPAETREVVASALNDVGRARTLNPNVDAAWRRRPAMQTPPDSCWQCEQSLGTGPDNCLTCTAKRAEDRAILDAVRVQFARHQRISDRCEALVRVCRKCDLSKYGAECSCKPRDPSPGVG